MTGLLLAPIVTLCLLITCSAAAAATPAPADRVKLAKQIQADKRLADVTARAEALLRTGFNAGDGYPEVWIRDFATFERVSLRVNDPAEVRASLLRIARFQRPDGNIPDGYGSHPPTEAMLAEARRTGKLVTTDAGWREFIVHPKLDDQAGFKNSVETDQESSLVLAIATYVDVTGDRSILEADIDGTPLLERLRDALRFLLHDRFDDEHGLIWGATTIDWGDIAPEDNPGAVLRDDSHRAIDVYDNALFVRAIDALLTLLPQDADERAEWQTTRDSIRENIRKHLWDAEQHKFRTHIYLGESPFPAAFDEEAVWYFGGTAVAIRAGILTDEEVVAAVKELQRVADDAGALTLGLTNWPYYPAGLFANDHVLPGQYQNGGDWDWFGGRFVIALIDRDEPELAYELLSPMLDRVERHDGFYEWFDAEDRPQGSGQFRGSAGVLAEAIEKLQAWADAQLK